MFSKRIRGIYIGAGKMATGWEAQIHRLWIKIHFPKYWKGCGSIGFIRVVELDEA